ncbi:MAG: N-6 DNA methylase [Firmicutes bacterium]|nr:N-6 DNA methylase [Bacillota bacterium]
MIAIRSNFFYTRSVPCELWFLNKDKPEEHKDKVLMIDARNIYRRVTRKIYDFSPEQEQNISAIVWLYRGQINRYLDLVSRYCTRSVDEARACLKDSDGDKLGPLSSFITAVDNLISQIRPFSEILGDKDDIRTAHTELEESLVTFKKNTESFAKSIREEMEARKTKEITNEELKKDIARLSTLVEKSRYLAKHVDSLYRLALELVKICESNRDAKDNGLWNGRKNTRNMKNIDEERRLAVEQLKQVRYFWKQAEWLTKRFPDAKLCDVKGLVKLVSLSEIEANDWSLTPGRYVGVAPAEEDEDFDFESSFRRIHAELEELNEQAITLADVINQNIEELVL